MAVTRENPLSLYVQLKMHIRDMVADRLQPGDKIPSERELCETYGVSITTVRQAIATLVNEGLLRREQGRGTFVAPPKAAETLAGGTSFDDLHTDLDESVHIQVMSAEMVSPDMRLKTKLPVTTSELVYKIRRLRISSGEPVAYQVIYLPCKAFPQLLQHDLTRPLGDLLEAEYGVRVVKAAETIECILADDRRSEILHVPKDAPIMVVERDAYLASGTGIEFSRSFFRCDRYKLRVLFTAAGWPAP